MHRLAAIGLFVEFLSADFTIVAAFSLVPSITFSGRIETAMLGADAASIGAARLVAAALP